MASVQTFQGRTLSYFFFYFCCCIIEAAVKLNTCPESRWDYASMGDYPTPSIPSAVDPRRAPRDPGRICSAHMIACTVKTLRENYEIVMQQMSIKGGKLYQNQILL